MAALKEQEVVLAHEDIATTPGDRDQLQHLLLNLVDNAVKYTPPGGTISIQAITMDHDRMLAASRAYTWIHKYIFPGGLIPSVTALEQALRARTRLRLVRRLDFGEDYARTLRTWRERFEERWPGAACSPRAAALPQRISQVLESASPSARMCTF